MTQAETTILLYLSLVALSVTVASMSSILLIITRRDPQDHGGSPQSSKPATTDTATQQAGPRDPFTPSMAPDVAPWIPPEADHANYRAVYERIGNAAREKRLHDSQDRKDMRLALSSLASKGFYIFEDIVTDAGPIQIFGVSRYGVHAVYLFNQEGAVWRDIPTNLIIHSEDTREQEIIGHYLPENPDVFADEVTKFLYKDLRLVRGETIWTLYCFTRAKIGGKSPTAAHPSTMCALIDLAWSLDLEDESRFALSETRMHEVADKVSEVYLREPIVRPLEIGRDV